MNVLSENKVRHGVPQENPIMRKWCNRSHRSLDSLCKPKEEEAETNLRSLDGNQTLILAGFSVNFIETAPMLTDFLNVSMPVTQPVKGANVTDSVELHERR